MADALTNDQKMEYKYDKEVRLRVLVYGDTSVITARATGYTILSGYLLLINDGLVTAVFNRDQWISVLEGN